MYKTFAEKIFGASSGTIVFSKPDIILTHDNTVSIKNTFLKMKGEKVIHPDKLLIVLDHNAPPTSSKLATQYQEIREFVNSQKIKNFYDAGRGICHQIMSYHAKPKMIIVGSDSHTCTAGAFNSMAVGIDRTEAAGLWKRGETWFRVPESIKITLNGKLKKGVYAKDLSLWIIGMIGSAGANYLSIEYHGEGVKTLSISERMTLTNLASEMGAKNSVFPADEVLAKFYGKEKIDGVFADEKANYLKEIEINLDEIFPIIAVPHNVDNIKSISQIKGKKVHQALIGTCTNGRLDDLRIASEILDGKKIAKNFQLTVTPASIEIYLKAIEEGIITKLVKAGATILSASCGACLGTGQGIPADNFNVISTANRNFLGRMGNKKSNVYLASPANVAYSALKGEISCSEDFLNDNKIFPYYKEIKKKLLINDNENRRINGVWDYSEIDNLNTDQMFAGHLTYKILSSDAKSILPYLFSDFDVNFSKNLRKNDVIIAGDNFGCGSSREHPAVALAHAGVKAVIVKSVNRIFYRSCINQGLLLIVNEEIVNNYKRNDKIEINFKNSFVKIENKKFSIPRLPEKLNQIIEKKGLINWILN